MNPLGRPLITRLGPAALYRHDHPPVRNTIKEMEDRLSAGQRVADNVVRVVSLAPPPFPNDRVSREESMEIQEAYTRWSATYDEDRNRTRDLDEIVTRKTLESPRCRSILEIGCGTGKNTAFLAEIGERVTALDFSEGMLARAREKVMAANITFQVADITQPWPVDDRSVDLVVCNLVLEHIEDLTFVFTETARVLVAGGRFFVCELHPFRQYEGTKANFERAGETTEIPAFVHNLSDFTHAAATSSLTLVSLNEWWHDEDTNRPPRLVSFLWLKR